jgi:hypothetical protein
MHSETFSEVAKARHSYRLRPGLARSGKPPCNMRQTQGYSA